MTFETDCSSGITRYHTICSLVSRLFHLPAWRWLICGLAQPASINHRLQSPHGCLHAHHLTEQWSLVWDVRSTAASSSEPYNHYQLSVLSMLVSGWSQTLQFPLMTHTHTHKQKHRMDSWNTCVAAAVFVSIYMDGLTSFQICLRTFLVKCYVVLCHGRRFSALVCG